MKMKNQLQELSDASNPVWDRSACLRQNEVGMLRQRNTVGAMCGTRLEPKRRAKGKKLLVCSEANSQ